MANGTIVISRNEDNCGKYRKLNVLLDNSNIGSLKINETREFTVKPGEYNLQVSMDWKKSRTLFVPIAENQIVKFITVVPGGETFFKTMLSIMGGKLPFFELERIRK